MPLDKGPNHDLRKRDSWADASVTSDTDDDDDDVEEEEMKQEDEHQTVSRNPRAMPKRRTSWDDIDILERLKLDEEGSDAENEDGDVKPKSFFYARPTKNIFLVAKLEDAPSLLESEGSDEQQQATNSSKKESKAALKGISNRLGLMSPFKAKKRSVVGN